MRTETCARFRLDDFNKFCEKISTINLFIQFTTIIVSLRVLEFLTEAEHATDLVYKIYIEIEIRNFYM